MKAKIKTRNAKQVKRASKQFKRVTPEQAIDTSLCVLDVAGVLLEALPTAADRRKMRSQVNELMGICAELLVQEGEKATEG